MTTVVSSKSFQQTPRHLNAHPFSPSLVDTFASVLLVAAFQTRCEWPVLLGRFQYL
jgi:hypothetical protein